MAKNTNTKVAPVTLASLSDQKAALLAQIAALDAQRSEVATKEANQISEVLNTFPSLLEKAVGRSFTLPEVGSLIRSLEKGTLGSIVNPDKVSIDRSHRLTDVEKANLRLKMLDRHVNKKLNKPAVQVSVLMKEFSSSYQTIMNYAPTETEVDAEIAKRATAAAAV